MAGMNRTQKIIILLAIVCLVLAMLIKTPVRPTYYDDKSSEYIRGTIGRGAYSQRSAGTPSTYKTVTDTRRGQDIIDWSRVVIRFLVVIIPSTGLFFVCKSNKG